MVIVLAMVLDVLQVSSKELRQSPLGTRLREIGFTSKNLMKTSINYSELMQTSQVDAPFMTDKQLIEGSLKYSKN